ncbi:MAG: hypothetical protein H7293_22425 [Candidatus Saccharibacteria bacterium]|nr:hypothetical protein [Rhodoferax sp.]
MFNFIYPAHARLRRFVKWGLLAGVLGVITLVVGQSVTPPLIALVSEPLYTNGAKTKGNLTLALSNEKPIVGAVYRNVFTPTTRYVGYFEPLACYQSILSSGTTGNYFNFTTLKASLSAVCKSSEMDGNFMNWATSSAIDIFRYGLTGGNRTLDESGNNARTVVERAWLPDDFYRDAGNFPQKYLSVSDMVGRTELAAGKFPNGAWIYNCRNRLYFATAEDTNALGLSTCDAPFGVAGAASPLLVTASASNQYYEVRNLICDSNTAPLRLMTYDPSTKRWSGLCKQYGTNYKPVGQLQVNADALRISVFSYLNGDVADSPARYGGVMRSPLKYVGPNAFDQDFNQIAGTNPRTEWDANSGVFIQDPQNGDSTYGNQGYTYSGAINYINKFGTLNLDPTASFAVRTVYQSRYKVNDPVSELYYEALRYLQGKSPTDEAIKNLSGTKATDATLTENFPAYRTWADPFSGFTDSTSVGKGCLRNSITTISDVFTTYDRTVPGNNVNNVGDSPRSKENSPALDVPVWTNVVGGFESGIPVDYTDSQGRAQTTSNLSGNTKYTWLSDASSRTTGVGAGTTTNTLTKEGTAGGSYHLAGMAYWANTQSFRSDLPKGRVKTYAIDVNQDNTSALNADFRRTRQVYLAAKYGGFDDIDANNTGNPYTGNSNLLWQGSDGEAKNYFLASDAQAFLDSLAELFTKAIEETGSIAGGAISSSRLTSTSSAAVYQARFNPVSNFWSGRVSKFPLSLSTDGSSIVIGSTSTWEAGQVLTTAAKVDNGASRNLVIGPPIGRQGTDSASAFKWANLVQAHKNALNLTPANVIDTLGERRLNYLRGDQRDELTGANTAGIFRPRDLVLGDIINGGLIYMGPPTSDIAETAYRTFFDANKSRKPVVFVNANDGMLHAFYDESGAEAFGYLPGFIAKGLNKLPSLSYTHATFVDATPAVSEAYFGNQWRTALVSGVGGGGRGVYALDVTNPATFTQASALWEFTERDHPAMGNVLGSPQILKFRVPSNSSTSPTYKWFAVVASGVNNYAPGSYTYTSGNPSLFFLDLGFVPSATQGWVEGTNFWRIELPQSSTAIAKGMLAFSSTKNLNTAAVDTLYAGDLQGNMWKLDFFTKGTTLLGTDAAANFATFNPLPSGKALYIAKASDGTSLQPITGEPVVVNSYYGQKLVTFGTGKFLESIDTSVPLSVTASFYAVLDVGTEITGRTALQQGSINSGGTLTVPTFTLGSPSSTTVKSGWYVDLNASIGERQVSDITAVFNQLIFGTSYPTKGSCGEGSGRLFIVDALTGNGISEGSRVGILAAPLVVSLDNASLDRSDTAGQRTARQKIGVITQGSKGLLPSSLTASSTYQTGRLSWRRIDNYQSTKAK